MGTARASRPRMTTTTARVVPCAGAGGSPLGGVPGAGSGEALGVRGRGAGSVWVAKTVTRRGRLQSQKRVSTLLETCGAKSNDVQVEFQGEIGGELSEQSSSSSVVAV